MYFPQTDIQLFHPYVQITFVSENIGTMLRNFYSSNMSFSEPYLRTIQIQRVRWGCTRAEQVVFKVTMLMKCVFFPYSI